MKIKLCGFTDKESIKTAIDEKCDFIGFVFHEKSPRNIEIENAVEISSIVPSNIFKVAVLVDADFEFLEKIASKFRPDFFQFHGSEDVEYLLESRKKFPNIKIIKAFRIAENKDLEDVQSFEDCADIFLFDAKNPGSGKSFDWKILKNFASKKEWFLSGGINSINVVEAAKETGAKMIDISSGIEELRGKKSSKLIIDFMKIARAI